MNVAKEQIHAVIPALIRWARTNVLAQLVISLIQMHVHALVSITIGIKIMMYKHKKLRFRK